MLHEVFVPGRLCILGEHTDWGAEYRDRNPAVAYGLTVVCATNEGLYASCSSMGTAPGCLRFTSVSYNGALNIIELNLDISELNKVAAESVR
jgi:galactokinase